MYLRTIDMIFGPSGQPVPSEEEVRLEACELLQRSGWGLPLLQRLRKIADPYWREAIARTLMNQWNELVRDKDEQTYYYDADGDIRYCWIDAESDFMHLIRRSTAEQVEEESGLEVRGLEARGLEVRGVGMPVASTRTQTIKNFYYIQTHNGPIITDSHVTIH